MTDYIALLRQKKPAVATAQTAKSTLRGLCSSPMALKSTISSNIASSHWLVHFANLEPLTVAFSPEASHAQVLSFYPDALAAEPFTPTVRSPASSMTGDEERAVLRWLAAIGEHDSVIGGEVLDACRRDPAARAYFIERAGYAVTDDDRRCCSQCGNLRSGVCTVAKPGGLVSAIRGYQPALVDILQRCAGYSPNASDTDQSAGRERGPGFVQRGTQHADH